MSFPKFTHRKKSHFKGILGFLPHSKDTTNWSFGQRPGNRSHPSSLDPLGPGREEEDHHLCRRRKRVGRLATLKQIPSNSRGKGWNETMNVCRGSPNRPNFAYDYPKDHLKTHSLFGLGLLWVFVMNGWCLEECFSISSWNLRSARMIGDAIKALLIHCYLCSLEGPSIATNGCILKATIPYSGEANPGFVELRKISVAKDISNLLAKFLGGKKQISCVSKYCDFVFVHWIHLRGGKSIML